jgi:hypothetical protein
VRIGASLLLVAVGSILRFAVSPPDHGARLATVGPVLMMLGALGLVVIGLSMIVRRPATDVELTARRRSPRPKPVERDGAHGVGERASGCPASRPVPLDQ